MAKVKTRIKRDVCIGCGTCPLVAPDVYEMGEDSIACVKAQHPDGVVSDPGLVEEVRTATESCPVEAIETEDLPE